VIYLDSQIPVAVIINYSLAAKFAAVEYKLEHYSAGSPHEHQVACHQVSGPEVVTTAIVQLAF
jgi:hypothetical protein